MTTTLNTDRPNTTPPPTKSAHLYADLSQVTGLDMRRLSRALTRHRAYIANINLSGLAGIRFGDDVTAPFTAGRRLATSLSSLNIRSSFGPG